MSNRIENTINKLVAKKDKSYYVLDYTFKESESFKGSVWTVFDAVNEDEYNQRFNDNSYFEEVWKNTVENDETRLWLDDYINGFSESDIEDFVFDTSYEWSKQYDEVMEVSQKELWNIKRLDCVGGWRSFSIWDEFDKIYDWKLFYEVIKYETIKKED